MNRKAVRATLLAASSVGFLALASSIFAATTQLTGVSQVAGNVVGNLGAIAKLITAIAYVAGMGFGVAAILKFKAHKDNPTQVSVGVPIAFLFISAALLFLPSIFKTAGGTLYSSGTAAGVSGVSTFL